MILFDTKDQQEAKNAMPTKRWINEMSGFGKYEMVIVNNEIRMGKKYFPPLFFFMPLKNSANFVYRMRIVIKIIFTINTGIKDAIKYLI